VGELVVCVRACVCCVVCVYGCVCMGVCMGVCVSVCVCISSMFTQQSDTGHCSLNWRKGQLMATNKKDKQTSETT
jgi:MFS superfamily sulfate permease-like transporter